MYDVLNSQAIDSLDNIKKTGLYRLDSSSDAGFGGFLLVFSMNNNLTLQVAIRSDNKGMKYRVYWLTEWRTWHTIAS